MTRRERLEAVIRGEISEELVSSCREELKKLDERSAKVLKEVRESMKYKENQELGRRIDEVLSGEPLQVEEIREKAGIGEEVSRQRLTAICTNLVREEKAEVVDLKVKGKGIRKGYKKKD